MIDRITLENIMFLDIETVPANKDYKGLSPEFKTFWDKKSSYFRKEEETGADVYQRAGIYAEFGRIVCISVGFIYIKNEEKHFRLKSFYGDNEKEFLYAFIKMVNKYIERKELTFCAHNGKEFDFPYLARRILINNLKLPSILEISGKKPWEVKFIDTMELWKFGDYKHFTSLELLAGLFRIPTPKDDIDGSMVADIFYKENNIERIVEYCEKDVLTVAQLLLRFRGEELIKTQNVERVD